MLHSLLDLLVVARAPIIRRLMAAHINLPQPPQHGLHDPEQLVRQLPPLQARLVLDWRLVVPRYSHRFAHLVAGAGRILPA